MSGKWWGLFWLLPPLGAYGLATLPPLPSPALSMAAPQPCTAAPPRLWMNNTASLPTPQGFSLYTNGTVYLQACRPGKLSFSARGTALGGRWPTMTVSVASQALLTTEVAVLKLKPYSVRIPSAGLIAITFHNDAFAPEAVPPQDRNLIVEEVEFTPQP
jgi:hypothetical protein